MRFAALLLCICSFAFGFQPNSIDTDELFKMSLDELLSLEVNISSQGISKPLRESPGIVTLYTEEDLAKLPARDLMDLLQWAPSFFTGVDVQGVVGLGIRGNWGHEGKILLVIDGMEMNELLYSTNQLGNHYPLTNLKKVEIIRGSGSALYGGNAKLAVISITTKKGAELDGAQLSLAAGQMSDALARRTAHALWGSLYRGWDLSASAWIGEGKRSDQHYRDLYGSQVEMAKANKLDPNQFTLAAAHEGLEIRVNWENYKTSAQDHYDLALSEPLNIDFISQNILLKYQRQLSKKLKILPSLNYRHYESWKQLSPLAASEETLFNDDVARVSANLNFIYTPNKRVEWVFGFSAYHENANIRSFDQDIEVSALEQIRFVNYAGFAQASFKALHLTWTLGGRYEDPHPFAGTFMPRLVATGLFGKFHLKGLLSHDIRSPNVENYSLNAEIKPEQTRVFEIETGYKLTQKSFVTLNLFNNKIIDPIVYYFDGVDRYDNFNLVTTWGIEAEYRYEGELWSTMLGYSNYQKVKNEVSEYEVSADQNALLGAPANKFSLRLNRKIGKHSAAMLSWVREGEKWGYVGLDEEENSVLGSFKPLNQVNLQLKSSKPLGIRGMELSLGLFNLLNEQLWHIQPYNSYHAALPGLSRELWLRADYHF